MNNNDFFYSYIANTDSLNHATADTLQALCNTYPWSASLRLLYVSNKHLLNELRNNEIADAALYLPNRKQLYLLRHNINLPVQIATIEIPSPLENEAKDAFSLIDSFLSEKDVKEESDGKILFENIATSDYLNWMNSKRTKDVSSKDEQSKNVTTVKFKHQTLIDSYLSGEKSDAKVEMPVDLQTDEKTSVDKSNFTETLAHIYVKQDKHEQALEIIRMLSLNNPEKNIFFADQIRFLEKLIINTKK